MKKPKISTWGEYANQNNNMSDITELEQACWSPWIASSPENMHGRAEAFPNGQLCLETDQGVLATLSVNQVNWDGNIENLPAWDQVAGEPPTYENTYKSDGNTLCLMSMNVSSLGRGQQLPKILIGELKEFAEESNIDHIIGSFRPSAYSQAVLEAVNNNQEPPSFEVYCQNLNQQGEPIDPWLRSLSKNGMKPLAIDHEAMHIPASEEEFNQLKQPDWRLIEIGGQAAWWCNETGFFYPQPDGSYVYKESNLWGTIYER